MKISREDVLRVAQLAHLELGAAEVEPMRSQLDEILTYIDKLNELDTSKVEPLSQVLAAGQAAGATWREDISVACGISKEALAGAPDPAPPYIRVPKVIERGEP